MTIDNEPGTYLRDIYADLTKQVTEFCRMPHLKPLRLLKERTD